MAIRPLQEADVDVCSACGGIWVDWFDGEHRAETTEVLATGPAARPSAPPEMRNEARATGACPRCARQLVSERFVVGGPGSGSGEGRASLATGAELLRCEGCAGAFVSATSAQVLAMLPADETPASDASAGAPPLPWQRLAAVLARPFARRVENPAWFRAPARPRVTPSFGFSRQNFPLSSRGLLARRRASGPSASGSGACGGLPASARPRSPRNGAPAPTRTRTGSST